MRNDEYRLRRICEIGNQLLGVLDSRSIDRGQVLSDLETQWLVTTPLFNIGEQANCISRELAEAHPDIPWSQIAGMRHRLAHNYEGTNWSVIASALFDELEPFIRQIEGLLAGDPSEQETQ